MSFSRVTLIGFLLNGAFYGYLVHEIIFNMYRGQMLHCVVSGVLFGLSSWIIFETAFRQNNRLKNDNSFLAHKARCDKLTGLLNREALEEDIALLKINVGESSRISVIFIDLDNFREFNNQFGHYTADEVLRKISQIIKNQVRNVDKVYRYGGEEILVILKDCDKHSASKIAEKIRKNVCQINEESYPNPTVSLGVACYPLDGNDMTDVIKARDHAMLKAKRTGKNCVVLTGIN